MKVLFVTHSANWAGAESTLYELLRRIDLESFDPTVLLPANGVLEDRLAALGVPLGFTPLVPWIDRSATRHWERFGDGLSARVSALARWIEREEVELVLTNSSVIVEPGLAARWVGVPHVWRVHETLHAHRNLAHRLPLEASFALLDALSDRVSCVSQAVADALTPHVDPARIEVIHNGVDPIGNDRASARAKLGATDEPILLFTGTVSDEKGAPLLVPVMTRVRRAFASARCVLVGADAGAQEQTKRLAREAGIAGAFTFLGFREDARSLVAGADIVLLPSRVESLPTVVMEAMAEGVAVVSSRTGGAIELIEDGVSGRLTEIGQPEPMAEAAIELLRDDAKRSSIAEAARARALRMFSGDAYVRAFEASFRELAEARVDPSPASAVAQLIDAVCRASAAGELDAEARTKLVTEAARAIRRPPR
ncbi:MAG: glycosyltransferase [Sandaracinaceae bacterium]